MLETDIATVADRLAINELMYRYARMVDFRQWHLHDEVFTPDASCDYTSTGGVKGAARDVMTWLDEALAAWPTNLHLVTNVSVEFEDGRDAARSSCYFLGPMAHGEIGSQVIITNGGLYIDRLERSDDGWRIADRECRMTLMLGSLPADYVIPT
ncbi:MAG: nuclear transport factor 2 family protein [Acidimicrobiales bacterium]